MMIYAELQGTSRKIYLDPNYQDKHLGGKAVDQIYEF